MKQSLCALWLAFHAGQLAAFLNKLFFFIEFFSSNQIWSAILPFVKD
jgi:hypothetical protein